MQFACIHRCSIWLHSTSACTLYTIYVITVEYSSLHSFGYRRWVLAKANTSVVQFTLNMIRAWISWWLAWAKEILYRRGKLSRTSKWNKKEYTVLEGKKRDNFTTKTRQNNLEMEINLLWKLQPTRDGIKAVQIDMYSKRTAMAAVSNAHFI